MCTLPRSADWRYLAGMRLRILPPLFLLLVAGAVPVRAGESLYVRAAGTELKSKAGPGGAVAGRLEIGTKCAVLSKQGGWTQVECQPAKGKKLSGWVFAAKMSKDKPDRERLGGKAVATASEGDTALAIRGLSPTAEKYAGRSDISPEHIAAVKEMESRKIAPEDLSRFLAEGKLAEYAE